MTAFFMKITLNEALLPTYELVISKLGRENVYLVGGCVRDTLLGRETSDLDFCCSLSPEVIHQAFEDSLYFEKYGTVSFKHDKNHVTIAALRKESDYKDYRHPGKVIFVKTIEEDFRRRDFTINSLYVDGNFDVIDPTGRGLKDLTNKIICLIGNFNQKLREDPLRILRACRFKLELGFTYSEETKKAMIEEEHLIGQLNPQKIKEELHKCPKKYQENMIEELHLKDYCCIIEHR